MLWPSVGQGQSESDAVPNVENQQSEDPFSGKFTWNIENFSKLNVRKHYSDVFTVGDYKW